MIIGNRVVIGWHATIIDSDLHPIDPAERMRDAVALSPPGDPASRPSFACAPVVIEDNVWIGPNASILKGVVIGHGAVVEPGSVVVGAVPASARVMGNPARIIEQR